MDLKKHIYTPYDESVIEDVFVETNLDDFIQMLVKEESTYALGVAIYNELTRFATTDLDEECAPEEIVDEAIDSPYIEEIKKAVKEEDFEELGQWLYKTLVEVANELNEGRV